jgi:hypothetical protein
MSAFSRTSDRTLPGTQQLRGDGYKENVLVEAVQRFDAAQRSYMMQNRRPKHRWCPGAELNHRHTDFQSVYIDIL